MALVSEKEYIAKYNDKGFDHNYQVVEGHLRDLDTKESFEPSEIHIVAEHRFEGISNPSDMSILYVIKTKDGHQGTVLANYSPASDTAMGEFFNSVPKENYSQKENIL